MIQFISDAMLGRLTRWLRILGHAVVYDHALSDSQILSIAHANNWILLTRDHELHQRAQQQGIHCIYLNGRTISDKLVELARHLSLSFHLDATFSRCAVCGARLEQVDKSMIQRDVPAGTLNHYTMFWQCENCSKIYWQGSHWNRISQTMTQVNNIINAIPPEIQKRK
jgi:uncharacterized protein with PIN domain